MEELNSKRFFERPSVDCINIFDQLVVPEGIKVLSKDAFLDLPFWIQKIIAKRRGLRYVYDASPEIVVIIDTSFILELNDFIERGKGSAKVHIFDRKLNRIVHMSPIIRRTKTYGMKLMKETMIGKAKADHIAGNCPFYEISFQ